MCEMRCFRRNRACQNTFQNILVASQREGILRYCFRYLRKTYLEAFLYVKPHIVIFLGDLLDEGSIASETEYQDYVHRFHRIFSLDGSQVRQSIEELASLSYTTRVTGIQGTDSKGEVALWDQMTAQNFLRANSSNFGVLWSGFSVMKSSVIRFPVIRNREIFRIILQSK